MSAAPIMQMYPYSWVYYALHYFILFIEFGDENQKKTDGVGERIKKLELYTPLFHSILNSILVLPISPLILRQKHSKI